MNSFEYDVDPDEIEVHWQPPRTEIENPVLLVWPGMLRDRWAAEVDDGVAWVVCHTTLYEDNEGEIQKVSRKVNPNEPIPWCVAEALLGYDSEYGPVEEVANPHTEEGEGFTNELLPDDQETLA
jgi:hypothetical protein